MIDHSDPGSWARFMRHQGITPVFHPFSNQLDPSGNDQRTDALDAALDGHDLADGRVVNSPHIAGDKQ